MFDCAVRSFSKAYSHRAMTILLCVLCWSLLSTAVSSARLQAAIIESVGSGNWSDPSTWSGARIPAASESVIIGQGHTVVYDLLSSEVMGELNVNGTLYHSRSTNTQLRVNNHIKVNAGGFLDMGTMEDPIPAEARTDILFVLTEAQAGAFQGGTALSGLRYPPLGLS